MKNESPACFGTRDTYLAKRRQADHSLYREYDTLRRMHFESITERRDGVRSRTAKQERASLFYCHARGSLDIFY